MKIPTDEFGSASAITERVAAETGGVKYETVGSLKGVEQLDLLDGSRTLVITRGDSGLALSTVPLP